MKKYKVQLLNKAEADLDEIYGYIVSEFKERSTAERLAGELENSILSSVEFPYRGNLLL